MRLVKTANKQGRVQVHLADKRYSDYPQFIRTCGGRDGSREFWKEYDGGESDLTCKKCRKLLDIGWVDS